MIAVETAVKKYGSIVGYLGITTDGDVVARVEGHGWEHLPAELSLMPPQMVSQVLTETLSDAYDAQAGYL